MTFDERINRLTERHESLTQSLELLARQVQDMREVVMEVAEDHENLKTLVTDIAEGTARLLHVAEIHERRLDRLESSD